VHRRRGIQLHGQGPNHRARSPPLSRRTPAPVVRLLLCIQAYPSNRPSPAHGANPIRPNTAPRIRLIPSNRGPSQPTGLTQSDPGYLIQGDPFPSTTEPLERSYRGAPLPPPSAAAGVWLVDRASSHVTPSTRCCQTIFAFIDIGGRVPAAWLPGTSW
jgi:hypothetical protein